MIQDEKIISQLKKFGLNNKAAVVYAALFSIGGAYPSKLATITKLNRSTVYKVLLDLSIKGLVTEIEKGKKLYYQIERPRKLITFAKYNLSRAEDTIEYAKKIVPELEGLFSLTPNKPIVRFFEGIEGIISIYEDHISEKTKYEMLAFSNTAEVTKFLPKKFLINYIKAKEKIGIITRGITPNTNIDKNYTRSVYKNVNKKIWPIIHQIKTEIFPYKIELTIYGDRKVSLLKLEEQQPIGIIIEDKTFHNTMEMIFELAWIGSKNTYTH